jgi:RNA polymerase sporulation-specific sigma factor
MRKPLRVDELAVLNLDLADICSHPFYLPNADREDIRQEAAVALVEAARCYQPGHGVPFRTFARHVIRRRLIDKVKHDRRQRRHTTQPVLHLDKTIGEDGGEPMTLHDILPAAGNVSDLAEARSELARIQHAMARLTDLERHAIATVANGYVYHGDKKTDNAAQRGRRKLRDAA